MKELNEKLRAGYPAIWTTTHEEQRCIDAMRAACTGYHVWTWDLVSGLSDGQNTQKQGDPIVALKAVSGLPEKSVLCIMDGHKYLKSVEYYRTLKTLLPACKATNRHIVFISPMCEIPLEVEKDITLVDFALPTCEELAELAHSVCTNNNIENNTDTSIVNAACGLTLCEAEDAIALSLVRHKRIDKGVLSKEKCNAIKKSGLLEVYDPVPIEQLGGLDVLKSDMQSYSACVRDSTLPRLTGVMLLGVPGTGKSLSAKVIASIFDLPLTRFDISACKGSLVGESERKMRQALSVIDAVSPCVVWIDEIEKVLSGVHSSGKTDSGTTASMFSTLLTWMSESTKLHYIVATCNDVSEILSLSQGALMRRFDDVYFVDVPTQEEKKDILDIMNGRYHTDIDYSWVRGDDQWTGAEIEKMVRMSCYHGVEKARAMIRPIALQNKDQIEAARTWARANARMASSPEQSTTVKERKVSL